MPNADPDIYSNAHPLPDLDHDDISPGVRPLVLALREAGLFTTDSGDGSNFEAGMECALPYPHVFIICPPERGEAACEAASGVLAANPGIIDWPAVVRCDKDLSEPNGTPITEYVAVTIEHEHAAELMSLAKLQTELARLDPVNLGCGTIASICDDGVAVRWVDGTDDVDESTVFALDNVDGLAGVLSLLPVGCATAMGDDGSLWEVIISAHHEGIPAARAYAIEHHGEGVES